MARPTIDQVPIGATVVATIDGVRRHCTVRGRIVNGTIEGYVPPVSPEDQKARAGRDMVHVEFSVPLRPMEAVTTGGTLFLESIEATLA